MSNGLARECEEPLEVLSELGSEDAHIARRLRQWRSEIDWQSHLAAECEAIWRKACRLRHC